MNFIFATVVLILLSTVYGRPGGSEDYDPDFGEEDKDMQNDNDDYGEGEDDDEGTDFPDPKINTRSQEFIAGENETVYLPCEISNADTLVTFWKKNSEIIFQDKFRFKTFGSNYELLPNRTLVIKNVGSNETAHYQCSFFLAENEEKSITHKLFVRSPPVIVSLEAANNKTVYERGDTLELKCEARGYPQPSIIWSFKGQRLDAVGESITIDNIGHSNAGTYQCLADNNVGSPAHKSIRIGVVHKPIVKIEKMTVNSAENYDSELICVVHAFPEAVVNWKKDGLNIKTDDRVTIRKEDHSYILKIAKTQISDFGEYTCSATNRIGKTERNVSLIGIPSPAQFLRGYEHHELRIPVLSWTIESNSPITEHLLQYRKVGEATWKVRKPEVTNPEGNIYTIREALPDLTQGQYESRVRSRNTYGWSQWSEHKTFNGIAASRSNKHHLNPSTSYETSYSDPETKSLENETTKENIRQGASSLNNGHESLVPSVSFLCLLLAFVAANQQ